MWQSPSAVYACCDVFQVEMVAQACCRTLVVLLLRQPDPNAASHPNLNSKNKVRVVAAMGVCACVVEALHLFPSSVQVRIADRSLVYICVYVCMYVCMYVCI